MKYLIHISRLLVGTLFIFSGLIKLNDPIGFSFKLEEYFGVTVLNLPVFEPYALVIAVLVVVYEVLLGVFLLIGYKPKFTVWNLLGMIIFFTFLTFYSAYFNKVTDCGCFGDAIKLTPWESFSKDVILLILIIILFFGLKHIKPIFSNLGLTIVSLLSFIFSFGFIYYVLMHLPVKDFRPYKIGDNIQQNMSIPEDAPEAIINYHWTFNKNGEDKIITTNGSYPSVEGEYISVDTETIRKAYEPPIHDFSMERDGEDFTEYLLNEEHLIVFISYNLARAERDGLIKLKATAKNALQKGYKVIGLTASGPKEQQQIANEYGFNFDFYFCDETALKTIVRSNPGILELNKGTILQKLHWNDLEDLKLESLPNATPNMNFDLKRQLDSIKVLDQKYRGENYNENWKLQDAIDSTNTIFIENIFKEYGYPGKSLVGEPTNNVAWFVIQHSNKIPEYINLMREAGKSGELPMTDVAMMEDRYLMTKGEEQVYGTQGNIENYNKDKLIKMIWPIKNADQVNKRREEVGFEQTIEEYSKLLFGDDFEYKSYTLEDINILRKNNKE
jgi:uncharacterized membrane protein YphA (DoxX/SURF4 family)